MPNLIVRLFCTAFIVCAFPIYAHALETVDCDVCYRCTQYNSYGSCIGQCVYDENYCGDCAVEDCEEGYIFNMETCQCEPDGEEPDVPGEECSKGDYALDNGECMSCPANEYTIVAGGACGISSNAGDITTCYLMSHDVSECQYKDNTGTFVMTQDCYYDNSADDSGDDTDF